LTILEVSPPICLPSNVIILLDSWSGCFSNIRSTWLLYFSNFWQLFSSFLLLSAASLLFNLWYKHYIFFETLIKFVCKCWYKYLWLFMISFISLSKINPRMAIDDSLWFFLFTSLWI
jgi:hypothetical protein